MSTDTPTEPTTTEPTTTEPTTTEPTTTEPTTTEPLIDISGTPVEAPAPAPITLNDILSTVDLIEQKEAADKATLESIGAMTFETLKAKLVQWAKAGFPNAYEIYQVRIVPPTICSDGTTREITNYIQFCSGKTIHEHVSVLQAKVTDMVVSFANMGSYIGIVISKPIS